VVQPYLLSILSSAAIAKTLVIYPLPPLTDVMGMFRTVKVMSRNLRSVIIVGIATNAISAAMLSRMENKAANRVHKKLTDTSVFVT